MSSAPGRELHSSGNNFVPTIRHDTYPFIDPKKSDMSGKSVLVTGSSKGVGKAIALSYAKAGASTIILGARSDQTSLIEELRTTATAAGRAAPRIIPLKLDITSRPSVERAATELHSTIPHIDILIHSAGLMETWTPITTSDPDSWWRTWETNILGTYLLARSFIPLLLASPTHGLKTLVALTSGGAHFALPGASAYQTSKLALIRLMEFVDAEYGDGGICAYALHPGGVVSEMSVKMPGWAREAFLKDSPELAGDTVAWLTRERRGWLSGRYVAAQWDMEEFEGKRGEIVGGDLLKVRMAVEAL
ncbi:MAG: hypothetical protein M1828_000350 [Chrysothrix sp. TS-e1954]|nr:MAG: hypothetical protein M1828_000350 [Chrysothrix sp. TS-e1954]